MWKPILAIVAVAACASSGPAPVSPVATTATPVLAPYERARALLADDKLEGLADAAHEIKAAAKAVGDERYARIATSAERLAKATYIAEARASFGSVSRHLVALLVSEPGLARGLHVFECPMVTTYKKWVQPTKELRNPYMGKRMLACGTETDWK